MSILLGVNIDHIATLRQARGTRFPDPVYAASIAEQAGADIITVHLREDRRHIQDRDVYLLQQTLQVPMNLEMAIAEEMLQIAERIQPEHCCLVPERRQELTTEGGLNVAANISAISEATERLTKAGSEVSLFIDPHEEQIAAAAKCKAPVVEIHTGHYANAKTAKEKTLSLAQITKGIEYAYSLGLKINAGHGLHYHNVQEIAAIPHVEALHIGHGIIARALFSGLEEAVRDMKRLIEAR